MAGVLPERLEGNELRSVGSRKEKGGLGGEGRFRDGAWFS